MAFLRELFTKPFTKDFILSGVFLFVVYGITHNPIVRPMPAVAQGKWSIQFMQHPLAGGFAGHNYLVLRNADGTIVSELHGLATDPVTNSWKYVGTNRTDELRVWEFDSPRYYLAEKTFPGIMLKEGNKEDMEALWSQGEKCEKPINNKHISYPPYGFSFKNETTNSNSVAYTLAQCMHLDTYHIGLWTPGDAVDLLAR
jgi:hypothetical protein